MTGGERVYVLGVLAVYLLLLAGLAQVGLVWRNRWRHERRSVTRMTGLRRAGGTWPYDGQREGDFS